MTHAAPSRLIAPGLRPPESRALCPDAAGFCPQRLERLTAVLQGEVTARRLPGAVAVIARRGKLALFNSVGALDPATGAPMASDAVFRIYSMTKPILSVAVMMLMEHGKLLLSDPVAKFLPEFAKQQVASL